MQDQDTYDSGHAEVERVRRHVLAVQERIRAITQQATENEATTPTYR